MHFYALFEQLLGISPNLPGKQFFTQPSFFSTKEKIFHGGKSFSPKGPVFCQKNFFTICLRFSSRKIFFTDFGRRIRV
jgi:hypothetical protein